MGETLDRAVAKAIERRIIIGKTSDGETWAGTECWLVKDSQPSEPPDDVLDKLTGQTFDVLLDRVHHGEIAVLAMRGDRRCRLFLRPDGITIWLDDALLTTIEAMLADEDEEGEPVPPVVSFAQCGGRYSQVGILTELGELLALVMPIRSINDQLTDGAGRLLH